MTWVMMTGQREYFRQRKCFWVNGNDQFLRVENNKLFLLMFKMTLGTLLSSTKEKWKWIKRGPAIKKAFVFIGGKNMNTNHYTRSELKNGRLLKSWRWTKYELQMEGMNYKIQIATVVVWLGGNKSIFYSCKEVKRCLGLEQRLCGED